MLAKLLAGAGGNSARALPSFVSSSINRVTTADNTVTAPSNIQNGDLLVAICFNNQNGKLVTPPSGFNVFHTENAVTNSLLVATKTAASESGNYTFTFDSSPADNTVAILVYRNATQVNTIGTITRAASATATAASITPTYSGTLCAVFANESSASVSTPPSGLTQRALQSGTTASLGVYDLSPQAATATSAHSLVWSVSGNVASIQFQVTNEPSVAPEFVASATGSTASGTTLTIDKPSSPNATLEGDLMIAFMCANNNRTWTGDTDWIEIADQGTNPNIRIAYKVAGASEGSSYTFTASSSAALAGGIITYRYASYDTIGTITTATDPLILPSVSPTLSQSLLLAFGARGANATVGTPTSMTSRISRTTSPSYNVAEQGVAKGPSGTRSMTVGSNSSVAGVMLAIKPTRSL